MADRDNTSKARPGDKRAPSTRSPSADPEREDSALLEAIEEERLRLMKADALLHCVLIAMDGDDGEDNNDEDEDDSREESRRPYYPSVIAIARDLVNQSINQLDSVRLKPMLRAMKRATPVDYSKTIDSGQRQDDEVKEGTPPAYLH